MFCPNCKAIYERIRTSYGIQEFCQCPGKRKADFMGALRSSESVPRSSHAKTSQISPEIVSERRRRNKPGKSTESITIPRKRVLSDYSQLSLEEKIISSNLKLPINWNKGKVGDLLQERINNVYERFYRPYEDLFLNQKTELRFLVFLQPNTNMNDFQVYRWGVGAFMRAREEIFNLVRWYQGTKLLLDKTAKIREKEGDYISPGDYFDQSNRNIYSNMNYLSQEIWCEKLISFWETFKKNNPDYDFRAPSTQELYNSWKKLLT